ncbi:MAG: DUF373 family protein [Desulfurococcaceae archaeon]
MTLSRNDKVLVLVVDFDDDLSLANVETPVIGYENVLKVGCSFGVVKPKDSDLNAIFVGLNTYNEFKNKGFNVEIAVVSGSREDGPASFIKISKQLDYLKEKLGFSHIYLVSDSPQDEAIIPLLNSYGKVIGIERAIVEQIRSVEETYLVLSKYLKKAFTEQPYAKYFLGIPGLLIFTYIVLFILGLSEYITWFSLLIFSIIMITKGFGVIDRIREFWRTSIFSGVLIGASTVLLTYTVIIVIIILYLEGYSFQALYSIVNLASYPLIIALILLLSSRVVYRIAKNDPRVWVEAIYGVIIVFFIVYLVNLNSKIETISSVDGLNKIIELLSIDYTVILTAMITVIVITIFFLILETLVFQIRK